MAALMFGDAERQAVERLIEQASKNVISYDTMRALADSQSSQPLPIMRDLTIDIRHGFTASFSIEQHAAAGPHLRHLSVGITQPGRAPNQAAVQLIMSEFGFINKLADCTCFVELLDNGSTAINVLEPVSGSWDEYAAAAAARRN